jgi:hypothetical protein
MFKRSILVLLLTIPMAAAWAQQVPGQPQWIWPFPPFWIMPAAPQPMPFPAPFWLWPAPVPVWPVPAGGAQGQQRAARPAAPPSVPTPQAVATPAPSLSAPAVATPPRESSGQPPGSQPGPPSVSLAPVPANAVPEAPAVPPVSDQLVVKPKEIPSVGTAPASGALGAGPGARAKETKGPASIRSETKKRGNRQTSRKTKRKPRKLCWQDGRLDVCK